LASGATNKNDPNDARSVAIAALRSPAVREVAAEDHTAVMKLWATRHRDLSRHRTRLGCRLHAGLCDLVPGGIPGEIGAAQAARLLDEVEPHGAGATARHELALEPVADGGRLDAQLRNTNKRLAAAVAASKTTTTELFGVGPIVIGDSGDVSRCASRDHFAADHATAPIEVSCGPRKIHRPWRRGNRRLNHAIHMVAITQIRLPHSDGRAYDDRKIAEGKTAKEALRALKRRISDALDRQLQLDARRAPASATAGPGGPAENDSEASVTGSHPEHRLFGEATPEPTTPYDRPRPAIARTPQANRAKRSKQGLDNKEASIWRLAAVAPRPDQSQQRQNGWPTGSR
jgi:hypothetical protein